MPDIEFVGADPGADGADDVLDTGPRRPVPRWVWLVAAALAVAVGVAVVVSGRSDRAPKAAASASPFGSIAPGPTSSQDTNPVEQIVALTSDGTSLYWVAAHRLYRAGPVGRVSASVAISPTGGDFSELQLVADPAEHTIWVVSHGSADSNGGAGNVEGFDTRDLHRVSRASARSLIGGAAVLGGALYVLAAGRLLRLRAGGSGFAAVAAVDPQARSLVTVGKALLFVEGGNASAIGRWTSAGGVARPVVLTTTDSSLAVIGSTVVLVGTRGGRSVLDTLSPVGRVGQRGVATGLTQLQLVAGGSRSVIVLGTAQAGLELACVTADGPAAATPRPVRVQARAQATSANVAVLHAMVFQAAGDGVQTVPFDTGCAG